MLDDCHVLIWWGHVRHAEITPETGQAIVKKITEGKLACIAIHSAHWSTPFVEAMNERTRLDLAEKLRADGNERVEVSYVTDPRYTVPKSDARLTPQASCEVSRRPLEGDGHLTALLLSCLPR